MHTGNRPGQSGLTHIQALYFDLIQTINYNELNGFQVVEDLLRWRDSWYRVIADRQPYPRLGAPRPGQFGVYPPLALLRTTRYDEWPADTIYIWTDAERLPRLRRLIEEHWSGCAISEVEQSDVEVAFGGMASADDRVLELWWD
jgi:hypothetical protein